MEQRATEIHDGLKHPVIDGDGHWMEPIPIFLECLREVGARNQSIKSERCGTEGTPGIGPHRKSVSTADFVAPSGGV